MSEYEAVLRELLDDILAGMEDRLAYGMTKALDTVVRDFDTRLQAIEEDQARLLRHLGLDI